MTQPTSGSATTTWTYDPASFRLQNIALTGVGGDDGVVLKAQNGSSANGEVEVLYSPSAGNTQVWTYAPSQDWVLRGTIAQSFASGDVLKAKARSTGSVEVYKNGTLIGTVDVSAWPLNASGGNIGLAMWNSPTSARLDDFGGGTSCSGTGTSTPTPVNTPTATAAASTPTPTATSTPTATPTGSGGSNLLTNGGFETGDLTGWDLWDSGQSVNNSNVRSGSYGARSTKGEVRQTFNTVAGQTYYVSAWMRIDSQQQAATWGGIRVLVTDLNWNELDDVVLTPATSPLRQWTRVQFSFVAAGTLSRLHAGPFTDGLYTVSMDDFIVSNSPIASVLVGAKVLAKPAVSASRQQSNFCTGRGYKAGCTITSYYYFNGQRVAMRVQSDANSTGVVTWLHGDMLGSASVATDAGGNKIVGSDTRYLPFGEARSGFAGSGLPTGRRYTGQISIAGGLIDMNARALDPLLGRFVSADTIVPNPADPQSLNRFAYTRNNPLRYTDPTGHYTDAEIVKIFGVNNYDAVIKQFEKGGEFDGKWGFLNLLHAAKNGDNVYFLGDSSSIGDGSLYASGKYNFNFDGKGLLAPGQVSRDGNACYLFPGELAGQVNGSSNGYVYEAYDSHGDVLGQLYYAAGQKANRPDAAGMLINSAALVIDTLSVIYGKGAPGSPGTALRTIWNGARIANGLYGGYQAIDSSALVVNKVVNGKSPDVFEIGNAGFDVASVADARAGVLNDLRGIYSAWINGIP